MARPLDVAQLWIDIADHLVPYFRLDPPEQVLYFHLVRHTRLLGRRTLRVSKTGLARTAGLCETTARDRLRSLAGRGCLRILDRGQEGHLVEVLLPHEIPGCLQPAPSPEALDLDSANCFKNRKLRAAILRRDRGRCFYCLRLLPPGTIALDHVVPLAAGGDHSYRNVVACCHECNSEKGDLPAPDFLRSLFRSFRLTSAELEQRLGALDSLQTGALKPSCL